MIGNECVLRGFARDRSLPEASSSNEGSFVDVTLVVSRIFRFTSLELTKL